MHAIFIKPTIALRKFSKNINNMNNLLPKKLLSNCGDIKNSVCLVTTNIRRDTNVSENDLLMMTCCLVECISAQSS